MDIDDVIQFSTPERYIVLKFGTVSETAFSR